MITDAELHPASKANQVKVVTVSGGARKQVVFQLMGTDGGAADLTQEVETAPAGRPDVPGARVGRGNVTVRLRAQVELGQPPAFDIEGELLDDPGVVAFELTETHTAHPGVYLAEVGQFLPGQRRLRSWPCYVLIEPSLFQVYDGSGPLSLHEIRLSLLDLIPDEVSLLDDMEFTDLQIAHALRRVVDLWNETPPRIQDYTALNFPYRHHWTVGTIAHLLDAAAARYRRNRLNYSAGGVSIDDQSKDTAYQEMAEAKKKEFMEWMRSEKMRLQMESCWSII